MVHVCSCLQLDLRNYLNLSEAGGVSTTDLNKLEELANTLASLLLTKAVSIHLKTDMFRHASWSYSIGTLMCAPRRSRGTECLRMFRSVCHIFPQTVTLCRFFAGFAARFPFAFAMPLLEDFPPSLQSCRVTRHTDLVGAVQIRAGDSFSG